MEHVFSEVPLYSETQVLKEKHIFDVLIVPALETSLDDMCP